MRYDEELAERLRLALTTEPDVTERKMFGGVALLVRGHIAVACGERAPGRRPTFNRCGRR